MQNTIFHVAANETLGVVRDFANAKTIAAPTLVRGVGVCLKMRLFAKREGMEAYPIESFDGIASWQWAMDNDFNESTTYKLTGDNAHISVAGIMELIDGEEVSYTEISIPIPDMNTEELATWLGAEKSKNGLHGELLGLDSTGSQVFIIQVENFTVRNRISSLGNPTPIDPDFLTAAQVRALLASGMECEFSSDGESWHADQTGLDTLVRFRLRGESGGAWSDPVALVAGPRGLPGVDSFCYAAYASDATGANFSLIPSSALKYRAEIHTSSPIAHPVAGDFASATWIKYIGEDGTGAGDMTRIVYDSDGDGRVDSADEAAHAEEADVVPWAGITDKPAAFAPASHTHTITELFDPVRQKVVSEPSPSTLYLDSPIVMNSVIHTNPFLEIDFQTLKDTPDGTVLQGEPGDFFTWEFHLKTNVTITGVAVGSLASSMVGITIPGQLDLVNNSTTIHVFVIRGIYKSGAVNNLILQVNYAYSYGA